MSAKIRITTDDNSHHPITFKRVGLLLHRITSEGFYKYDCHVFFVRDLCMNFSETP